MIAPVLPLLLQVAAGSVQPLGPIGTQTLPARGCAAYLWSTADRQLVAMASADPAQLRLAIDGTIRNLPRVAQVGTDAGVGGLGGTATYRDGGTVATLTMTVEAQQSLVGGARVPDGVLTVEQAGRDGVALPVAGLVGCRG